MLVTTQVADGSAQPGVTGRDRVLALDAARALAVIGMFAVNVGPRNGAGPLWRLYTLPVGRASILFVLLAGMGCSLMTRRARLGEPVRRTWLVIAWRAMLLCVAGLALQLLDHEVRVILPTYAALFLLAGALVRAPDRVLLAGAAGLAVIGPMVWLLAVPKGGRDPADLTDSPAQILDAVLLSGPYPLITWSAPFLFGLWLGRRELTDRTLHRRLAGWGAVVAVAASVVSAVATTAIYDPAGSRATLLVTSVGHGQMPLWLVGATGSAAAVLGLVMLLVTDAGRWSWALVATGQLALTAYVAHLLVLAVIRPAPYSFGQGALITVAISAAVVVLATVWRSRFARGPLEAALRPSWLVGQPLGAAR